MSDIIFVGSMVHAEPIQAYSFDYKAIIQCENGHALYIDSSRQVTHLSESEMDRCKLTERDIDQIEDLIDSDFTVMDNRGTPIFVKMDLFTKVVVKGAWIGYKDAFWWSLVKSVVFVFDRLIILLCVMSVVGTFVVRRLLKWKVK